MRSTADSDDSSPAHRPHTRARSRLRCRQRGQMPIPSRPLTGKWYPSAHLAKPSSKNHRICFLATIEWKIFFTCEPFSCSEQKLWLSAKSFCAQRVQFARISRVTSPSGSLESTEKRTWFLGSNTSVISTANGPFSLLPPITFPLIETSLGPGTFSQTNQTRSCASKVRGRPNFLLWREVAKVEVLSQAPRSRMMWGIRCSPSPLNLSRGDGENVTSLSPGEWGWG